MPGKFEKKIKKVLTYNEVVIEYLQGDSPKQRSFMMCDLIDQEVINHEVEALQKRRNEAREILRNACKNAGGNYDIIVFRNDHKRIIRVLEDLRIFWSEVNREILVSRHELYDIVLPKE